MPHLLHPAKPRSHHPHTLAVKGFTLLELLLVTALIAILVSLALPSFSSLLERLRVRQSTMELKNALQLARSEAVRRGDDIKIRKRDRFEERVCTGAPGDWSCGGSVFYGHNGNGQSDASASDADALLQIFTPAKGTSIRFTSNASVLTVNRWGAINGVAASFVISPDHAALSPENTSFTMVLCISSGGRIRQQAGSSCS